MLHYFNSGRKVVFALFSQRGELEEAVLGLKSRGFNQHDVSAVLPSAESLGEFVFEMSPRPAEASASGAFGAGSLAGALSWLSGAGVLAVPGVGPIVAAGPIFGMLAGAALVGGVVAVLVGSGVSETKARSVALAINHGSYLLSVHVADEPFIKLAKRIMREAGAHMITQAKKESGAVCLPAESRL